MAESPDDPGLIAEQIDYYRARAGEYDEWYLRQGRYDHGPEWNGVFQAELEEVHQALRRFGPGGQVLELASGTGWWTGTLAAGNHHRQDQEEGVTVRYLNDGRSYRIIKVFYQPEELSHRLRELGWRVEVRETRHYFLYGSGSRAE